MRRGWSCSSPGCVVPTGVVPPSTESVMCQRMSSGDNVVDHGIHGDVLQDAE